jgi:hypothetical protein
MPLFKKEILCQIEGEPLLLAACSDVSFLKNPLIFEGRKHE